MSFFYVKNSLGTRTTGGGTTQQTGTFASLGAGNVYATVANAITDGAGAGDHIILSDAHSESSASNTTITGPSSGESLVIATVDDSNCDQSSIASSAQITTTGSGLISWVGRIRFYGVYMDAANQFQNNDADGSSFLTDCTLHIANVADYIDIRNAGNIVFFVNTTFSSGDSGAHVLKALSGPLISIYGGSCSGTFDDFITGTASGFAGGGATFEVRGLDLNGVKGYLLADAGGNFAEDEITVKLYGCRLDASLTGFVEETFVSQSHRFEAYNCASSSAEAEYQFHIEGFGGHVDNQDDTGIHRDESTAFPSGAKVSAHCVTTSGATFINPFWFELPTRYAELSTTDTIRIYLASTSSLTDRDVWVVMLYPDGTNSHLYNRISTMDSDVLGSGTALTTDSGSTWKNGASDLTGYNEYYIDVDTSGDAGADSVPMIRIYVGLASAVIYFDTTLGAV